MNSEFEKSLRRGRLSVYNLKNLIISINYFHTI